MNVNAKSQRICKVKTFKSLQFKITKKQKETTVYSLLLNLKICQSPPLQLKLSIKKQINAKKFSNYLTQLTDLAQM